MTCDKVMSLMSAHMDTELGCDELRQVELHLAECEACRSEYAALKATKDLVGTLKAAELPRDFWPGLRRKLGANAAEGASTTQAARHTMANPESHGSRWDGRSWWGGALRPRSGILVWPLARVLAPALVVAALVAVPLAWSAYRRPAETRTQSLVDTMEPYFRDYVISEYDRPLSDKTSVGFVATAQAVTMYTSDRLQLLEAPKPVTSTGSMWNGPRGETGAAGVEYTMLSEPR